MTSASSAATHDLRLLPISASADRSSAATFDPSVLIEACLASIAAHDGRLRSFSSLFESQARQQAAESALRIRERRPLSQLDGVPVALKDVFDVADSITSGNSFAFKNERAITDSDVVRVLRRAGAVMLGKNTLYELCSGDPDEGMAPAARNPWNLNAATGGSSSGSAAAVAAGFVPVALGTDTGGSVRIPASYCGVAGFKPSYGVVSMRGVLPLAWSLDHVGILARTVADIVPVFAAISEQDANAMPAVDGGIVGSRIAAPLDFVDATPGVDGEVLRCYSDALDMLRELGARVQRVALPQVEHVQVVADVIARSEALSFHRGRLQTAGDLYGKGMLTYLAKGACHTAEEYISARRGQVLIRNAFARLMDDCDMIVLPTTSTPAGPLNLRLPDLSKTHFTRPFNITGQPAISVMMGVSSDGRPLGLQFAGRFGDDFKLLAAAQAFERAARTNGIELALATAARYRT